jgi:hypothetical protein
MSEWSAPLLTLLELQQRLERGPKREGAFALWLLVRVALDLGAGSSPAQLKSDRRRILLLGQRLAPLTVPRPLARGLTAALGHLEEATPAAARVALAQLVAPARDALGTEAAEAVAQGLAMLQDSRNEVARR